MADDHGGSGWYPDPSGRHQLRYFAESWTDHVSDGGVVTTAPLVAPPLQPAPMASAPPPFGTGVSGYPGGVAGPSGPAYLAPPPGVVGQLGAGVATPVARAKPRGAVLVLVGAILMVLGPLFPWETVSAAGVLYAGGTVKGTSEGAGPVVLTAGLVAVLLAVLVLTGTIGRRKAGIATLLIAVVSLVFCIGNWSAISKDIDKAPSGVDANIGIGLILAVVGCVLAAIASIGLVRRRA